ncbi:HK97 family phage portal protein [Saccharothrix ecbatanensis]|uniref:HK97 family phage portal protein n=1 Tax=Saccharothrix ecbatanensis TaxID=1105145 RepID=A0A7W9HLT7_9PSEU|nr:HK97 family phage portal protein [Saccharothrix ecbatanensis]
MFNSISDSIAQSPVDIYRKTNGVDVEVTSRPKWIDRPNADQTPYEFWEQVVQSMLYYGNAYIYKLRSGNKILELHVLHPDDIEVKQEVRFGPRTYTVQGFDGELTKDDILHIKAYGGPDSLYGISPVQAAATFVSSASSAQDYSAGLYDHNLNLAGVIEIPQKAGKDLSPDEAARIGKVFADSHKPSAEGGTPIGVLGGGATFKPISLTPQQAQLIESDQWSAQKFATLLNVPAFMVDASAGSWAGRGLQVMNLWYQQRSLQPWVRRIEDAFSTFLLSAGLRMKFNLDAILRSSTNERYDAHTKAINAGWRTRNEVRALEGLKPINGLDEPIVPQWMFNASDQAAQADLTQEKLQKEIDEIGDDSPGGENA